jgi:beta-lactamase regulating signal transducer with metallopeptidase domain
MAYWLDDSVLPFFILTGALLAIGCGLMAVMRWPAHRQRTGELTLVAIFAWSMMACLPLPRLLPERVWTQTNLPVAEPVHQATATVDEDSPFGSTSSYVTEPEAALSHALQSSNRSLDIRRPVQRSPTATSTASLDEAIDAARRLPVAVPSGTARGDADAPWARWFAATTLSRVTIAYLGGAAACILWLACGRIRLARIRRAARQPPVWLAEMFAALCEGARRQPVLLVSRHSARPISWGTWHPIIVVPQALARRRHREQLRMVLLHELAHVVRGDGWGNSLVCLGLPLLYPHPSFWWLRAQVRLAAELLADDWAAQRGGKLAYVEQLVSIARSSRPQSPSRDLLPLAGALTLYSSSSQFYRRMQMLISRTCPLSVVPSARWRLSSLGATALIALTAASMVGIRPASGQQPPASGDAVVAPVPPKAPEKPAQPPAAPLSADSVPESGRVLTELPLVGRLFEVAQAPGEVQGNAEEQALRARLAAAEERVRQLEAQLRLNGRAKLPEGAGAASGKTANTVTLTRVEEDGSISHETWTMGEDGRPDKLLSRAVARSGAESPIAAAKPGTVRDGRVVKEFTDKDGTVTTQVFDPQSGRLIEMRRAGAWGGAASGTKSGDGTGEPKTATRAGSAVAVSPIRPHAQPLGPGHGAPSVGAGGAEIGGLDLVNLATAYADAVGAAEEAEAKVAEIESSNQPDRGLAPAKAAVRSARRKQELLRNLASVATDAARADLERVQQLIRAGAASAESAAAAESRWKMLNTILQSGATGTQGGSPGKADPTQPGLLQ